ncbi:hypothetical protein [Sphingobacterium cavernae]|uniref:hypothetical protein n=1 Tax=Sphingobacterium cavernae TaxID=2592657 RepID=UPI00122FF06E|nr:hypothetical protein [Sphingobacterium cavernae]
MCGSIIPKDGISQSPKIKEPVEKAIEQHLRNQQEDGIRSLYLYSNLTLALATHQAKYGTTATSKEFWGVRKEMFRTKQEERLWENEINILKHSPVFIFFGFLIKRTLDLDNTTIDLENSIIFILTNFVS